MSSMRPVMLTAAQHTSPALQDDALEHVDGNELAGHLPMSAQATVVMPIRPVGSEIQHSCVAVQVLLPHIVAVIGGTAGCAGPPPSPAGGVDVAPLAPGWVLPLAAVVAPEPPTGTGVTTPVVPELPTASPELPTTLLLPLLSPPSSVTSEPVVSEDDCPPHAHAAEEAEIKSVHHAIFFIDPPDCFAFTRRMREGTHTRRTSTVSAAQ
jgi:hypothetical protein